MPRTSASRRRRRLNAPERREVILRAAAEVFAQRGYHDASIEEIARRAGIAPSVIYDHFRSKSQLHVELLERHAAKLMVRALHQLDDLPPHERLRANTEAFFDFVEGDRYAWRMLFRDPPAEPAIAAAHERINQAAQKMIADLFTAPRASNARRTRQRQTAELLAQAIKSVNDGLAAWWYENPNVSRRTIVEAAVSFSSAGMSSLLRRSAE